MHDIADADRHPVGEAINFSKLPLDFGIIHYASRHAVHPGPRAGGARTELLRNGLHLRLAARDPAAGAAPRGRAA
jgi:hypothetical protein